MKKVFTLVLAAALTGVFSGGPAGAQSGTVIVAGPDAQTAGYATPVMVVWAGEELTFVNADIMGHNVVSNQTGPSTGSWCVLFAPGECPLFWSELIGVGTTPVLGLENAVPGQIYTFRCEPHAAMKGTLVVLPEA